MNGLYGLLVGAIFLLAAGPLPPSGLLTLNASPPPTDRMKTAGGPRVVLDSTVDLMSKDLELWTKRISLLDVAVVTDPKPGRLGTVLLVLKRKWRQSERDLNQLKVTSPDKRSTLASRVTSRFSEMERIYGKVYAE